MAPDSNSKQRIQVSGHIFLNVVRQPKTTKKLFTSIDVDESVLRLIVSMKIFFFLNKF